MKIKRYQNKKNFLFFIIRPILRKLKQKIFFLLKKNEYNNQIKLFIDLKKTS